MKILQFFQEENGQFSSSRLLAFLVAVAMVVDYMYSVFATTAHAWHPDLNLVLILLTVVTGKAVGKFGETKTTTDTLTTESK
ncbi:MAG: hypothetical protein ABR980_09460 [Ignavibacteriaceae bacterium]|jgi:hypothetical protein